MIQRAVGYVTGDRPGTQDAPGHRHCATQARTTSTRARACELRFLDVRRGGRRQRDAGVLDLHTVDLAAYDVVVVASDHGGWLRQAELDILNARKADIEAYLRNGGGLRGVRRGIPGSALTTTDGSSSSAAPSTA